MNILRPLSPHLPIYKPQLTSTFPISHRISGAFLATIVLFFYLLCLKIGLICFTYDNFYQFFFYSSKFILIPVEITALALSYHLYNGLRLLFIRFFFKRHSPPLFSMWTHLREIPFRRDFFSKWLPFILSKILPGLAIYLLFFFFPLYLEKRDFHKSTNIYSRFINLLDPKPLVNIVPRDAVKTREELQRKSPDFLYWDLQWKTKEATCFELSKLLEKNGINFPGNISVGLLDPFFRNLGNPNSDFQFDLRVYQDLLSWQDQSQFYKEFLMFIKQHKLIFIYDKFKGGKLGAG